MYRIQLSREQAGNCNLLCHKAQQRVQTCAAMGGAYIGSRINGVRFALSVAARDRNCQVHVASRNDHARVSRYMKTVARSTISTVRALPATLPRVPQASRRQPVRGRAGSEYWRQDTAACSRGSSSALRRYRHRRQRGSYPEPLHAITLKYAHRGTRKDKIERDSLPTSHAAEIQSPGF